VSILADVTATELLPHGELEGNTAEASAGAIAKPEARKAPAETQRTARPARMIPAGTTVLRSLNRPKPTPPSDL